MTDLKRPRVRSVLLVDDDDRVVRALSRDFRELGIEVWTASSPDEAATQARDRAVDFAVVDLILYDSLGVEVIHALRRARPELPIVLCSGYARFDWVGDLARTGGVRCIEKPVNARDLLTALDSEP